MGKNLSPTHLFAFYVPKQNVEEVLSALFSNGGSGAIMDTVTERLHVFGYHIEHHLYCAVGGNTSNLDSVTLESHSIFFRPVFSYLLVPCLGLQTWSRRTLVEFHSAKR